MIIHYLPPETTKEDIKTIREQYKSIGEKVMLVVSGQGDLKENLADFIVTRK